MDTTPLLEIQDLHVNVGDKPVLKGINLRINSGEVHAIFGPNGSGKTTLVNTVMGFSGYTVAQGRIIFKGQDITHLPINERAQLGIGMSFQRPPIIRGVTLGQLVEVSARRNGGLLDRYAAELNVGQFLPREINLGFSGGEIKRAELLQLLLQDPDMVFLDEPESGVDLQNIALIGNAINELLGRRVERNRDETLMQAHHRRRKAGLVITHTGHILEYVDVDMGHTLMYGRLACEGNPREMLREIRDNGFDECYRCFRLGVIDELDG